MGSPLDDYEPLTRGEADYWARRLRKVGFSPVEVRWHHGRYYIHCNWPYDRANWPPDIVDSLETYLSQGGYVYSLVSEEIAIAHRADARKALRIYGSLRQGVGSRPLPTPPSPSEYPALIPPGRIASDPP